MFLSNNGTTNIALVRTVEYFNTINSINWEMNWCFNTYKRQYVNTRNSALVDNPGLADNVCNWKRKLSGTRFIHRILLCCPEDVQRSVEHLSSELCEHRRFPLCRDRFSISRRSGDFNVAVPEALANDSY